MGITRANHVAHENPQPQNLPKNKTMSKTRTRLNKVTRELLHAHARSTLTATKEQSAFDQAKADFLDLLKVEHRKNFSLAEIKILKKFEVFKTPTTVVFFTEDTAGQYRKDVTLTEAEAAKFGVPDKGWDTSGICIVDTNSPLANAFYTLEKADDQLNSAQRAIFRDMDVLISSSKTLEEVEEIWELSDDIKVQIRKPKTALSSLSSDMMKRIKGYQG